MAYQAIYRKWRPMIFEDIVGQGHITQTLKNQIINGRIGHAYLFCGTRGTGKTTAAKVFARAVNCLNPKDGSPCNECEVCRGILDGSIMDVTEIDAASNNGVDNIRELREDTKYAAAAAKYRVYIIDEVHMLSSGAFNALLKTLEEPPEHVIFILATTEVHKIPQTILSRCQRFDFRRIRSADIIARLKEIAYGEGLCISEDAYNILARLADGSMRDGLSVLERIISACGNNITAEAITDTLSIVDTDVEFKMADAIASKNSEAVFDIIDDVVMQGRDLHVFIDNLTAHFRNLLVCKLTRSPEHLLDYGSEEIVHFKAQSERITSERISFVIDALSEARANCKWLKSPRVMYEIALLRLCTPELDSSELAISDRLSAVEEKIKNGVPSVSPEKKEEKPKVAAVPKKKPSGKLFNPPAADLLTGDNPVVAAAKKWNKLVAPIIKTDAYLTKILSGRNVTIDADGIIMIFNRDKEGFLKQIADQYKATIREGFVKASGIDCEVKSAYYDEIQDYIVDIWSLPSKQDDEKKENDISPNEDPLKKVMHDFEDVIKLTDESDFLDFNPDESRFEQSDIDDNSDEDESDDSEEFLEDNELESDKNMP